MCGIAGILKLNNSDEINVKSLTEMVSVLRHRGPDETGAYIDDHIGLVHSRLSIIDIEKGTQPIHNYDETLWITYNGEVYNYHELKEELIQKGHRFYTSSDTEVVLHLYEEKGIDFINELNGQFAFAIWDTRKKELLLVRDRVGIRPLHYTISNHQFLFASEIKSIFTQRNVHRAIDRKSLNHIFRYWTTIPGTTVFEEVKELPPAHYLIISEGKIDLQRYWDYPFVSNKDKIYQSLNKINEKIYDILLNSIKLRLRADVSVGGYLSGGLDSSVIATLVKNNFNNYLKTFGIRFTIPDFDEGKYQKEIVKFLKTQHEEVIANNTNISNYFADVLWYTEKPLLRTAPVPMYLLSKHVYKSNIKVVLTGEGGDEFFGGYNIFKEAKIRQFWAKVPDSKIRPNLLEKIYPYIFKGSKLNLLNKTYFEKGLDQFNSPYFSHLIRWENSNRIRNLLKPDFFISDLNDTALLSQFLPNNFDKRDYFEKTQYLECIIFMSNYLLSSQGDRVALANSVEVRFPYLDHRLIELLANVPSKFKIYGMNEKYLLKRSFKKQIPVNIINRNKYPYRAPVKKSLLGVTNQSNVEKYCSNENLKGAGIFKEEYVKKLFNKVGQNNLVSEWEDMAVAAIYSTQVIYDQFIGNSITSGNNKLKFDLFIDNRRSKIADKWKK